jgi:1,4-alpha-glucan branching enzyme
MILHGISTRCYFTDIPFWNPEFMVLVDRLHQAELGYSGSTLLSDTHYGLGFFDGSNLLNIQGYHPDWKSLVFNYGRNEVFFLI